MGTIKTVLKYAFVDKWACISISAVLIFQACYSIAPVYLASVVSKTSDVAKIKIAILVFVALYFLPYLLSYVAFMAKAAWKAGARKWVSGYAFSRIFGNVPISHDRDRRNRFNAIIVSNAQEIVSDAVDFVYGTASLLASSLFSITLISAFIVRDFIYSYLISIILCAGLTALMGKWQTKNANKAEEAFNRFVSGFPDAWFSATLGESEFFGRFQHIFGKRWSAYRARLLNYVNSFQLFSLVQAVCIWTPTFLVIAWQTQTMSLAELVAVCLVLPRITEALLDISGLVSNVTDFLSLSGRIQWVEEEFANVIDSPFQERMQWGKIQIRGQNIKNPKNLCQTWIDDSSGIPISNGLLTVTGANGSGKTSLLLSLKLKLGNKAIYIPANGTLLPERRTGGSEGQRKMHDLTSILNHKSIAGKVLLLDEWNANLDRANEHCIAKQLKFLSQNQLIIEARHKFNQHFQKNVELREISHPAI